MFTRPRTWLFASLAMSIALGLFQSRIDPYFTDILMRIGMNIMLAVSLNLINGHTGQFSLGHAGFMAVGAYTAAAVSMFFGPQFLTSDFGLFWGQSSPKWLGGACVSILFILSLLAGGLVAAGAGLFVGAPSLRLKGDYLAIVTLGFGQIIAVVFRNIEPLGGALGLNGIPAYTNLFWVFTAAALTTYVITAMVNSTYGRGFLATHDDEVAAEATGINTTRFKIVAFVIGAFFAGIAGGLYGHFTTTINPRGFDFTRSIEIVVMVIVGGMGNTVGVILAAVLLTLMPEGLRTLSGVSPSLQWIGESRPLLYSILLISLMLLRPQGLFSFRKSARVKV